MQAPWLARGGPMHPRHIRRRGLVAAAVLLCLLVRGAGGDARTEPAQNAATAASGPRPAALGRAGPGDGPRVWGAAGSRAVNDEILQARSVEQLCALIERSTHALDPVNVNTAFRRLLLPQGQPERNATAAALPLLDRAVRLLLRRALVLLRQGGGQHSRQFGPREISNMLHALAKSGRPCCRLSEALIVAFEQRCLACMPAWNGQDIGNVLWAYAVLGRAPAPPLLEALQGQAVLMARWFSAQQISNTLWAFATLKLSPRERLVSALTQRAEAIVGEFNAQNVANTVWAFASLAKDSNWAPCGRQRARFEHLLDSLALRAEQIAGEFNSQNLANFMWSFAQFRIAPDGELMEMMEERAQQLMPTLPPSMLSILMLSLAALGWVPREALLKQMVRRINVSAQSFNAQDTANALWAMAVYIARGVKCHSLQLALQPLAKRTQDLEHAFSPQQVSALHHFALACEKSSADGPAASVSPSAVRETNSSQDLDTIIPQMLDPHTHVRTSDAPQTSRSQLQVAATLKQLGFSVESELYCSQSGLSIDIRATRTVGAPPGPLEEQAFTVEVGSLVGMRNNVCGHRARAFPARRVLHVWASFWSKGSRTLHGPRTPGFSSVRACLSALRAS